MVTISFEGCLPLAKMLCQKYMGLGLNVTILRARPIIGAGRLGIFGILFDWVKKGKKNYIMPENNRFYNGSLEEKCFDKAYKILTSFEHSHRVGC